MLRRIYILLSLVRGGSVFFCTDEYGRIQYLGHVRTILEPQPIDRPYGCGIATTNYVVYFWYYEGVGQFVVCPD
jgi:hypothetical protein